MLTTLRYLPCKALVIQGKVSLLSSEKNQLERNLNGKISILPHLKGSKYFFDDKLALDLIAEV